MEVLGLRCDLGRVLYSGTQEVLRNLSKVHTLGLFVANSTNIHDHTMAYLSEILRHPAVVFPQLFTLYLQCVRFRQDMPIFLRILSQRGQKAPIAQLVLRGCDDVTPQDICMLISGDPPSVRHVDWDEKTSAAFLTTFRPLRL